MRRALAIAAAVAMMLAGGEPALAQTPSLQPQLQPKVQLQPKIQPRPQAPKTNRPPNMALIKPYQALVIAQRAVPNSKAVGVKLLPGGNYAVTLKRNREAVRVIVDGSTGDLR
jgi:hypothetical protein